MKMTKLLTGCIIALFTFVSCQRDLEQVAIIESTPETSETGRKPPSSANNQPNPYTITLIGPVQQGPNWVWTWKIQNLNPGNGSNGTAQGLSHWGFPSPGACFNVSNIVSAAYSPNNIDWTSFTPTIAPDPSSCVSTPVMKFDFGTNGSAPSYFRIITNMNYAPSSVQGYYKSGNRTGCGTFTFQGISCLPAIPFGS